MKLLIDPPVEVTSGETLDEVTETLEQMISEVY